MNMNEGQQQLTSSPRVEASSGTATAPTSSSRDSSSTNQDVAAAVHVKCRMHSQQHGHSATRVTIQGLQTKAFNYSRVQNKKRRPQQIDDLDRRLREEQEHSRRLRSAVTILEGRLNAAEEGRRRSNGLERAFFSHLTEIEALVLQRNRLIEAGADETRAECLEAARREAHERLALTLRGEMEENSVSSASGKVEPARSGTSTTVHPTAVHAGGRGKSDVDDHHHGANPQQQRRNRSFPPAKPIREKSEQGAGTEHHRSSGQCIHRNKQGRTDASKSSFAMPCDEENPENDPHGLMRGSCRPCVSTSCWESDVVTQAYRNAAATTVRRLSSALFGQELLAVEAARTSVAERERMLQERMTTLFDSQVSLQVEKDRIEHFKSSLRAELKEAKAGLKKAKEENKQQQNMAEDAERVHSRLSWRILSMQVARDELAEALGERLGAIQAAVRRRVGFLPRAVERAVNDLVALSSAAGPSLGEEDDSNGTDVDKGLLLLRKGGSRGSTSSSRSSTFKSLS